MREYFAGIFISEIEEFIPLYEKKVLDVGGAKGEFCKVISKERECEAVNLDPDPGNFLWPRTIKGCADNLPFSENEFDLVICRGVLEHIPPGRQQRSVGEMYRVVKRDGFCYIIIPPWYNLHAGHGLKPFHYFPFKVAKFLRELFFSRKITANSYEESNLYPITFRRMLEMIMASGFKLLATRDTHLRLHFLTRIPIIREIAVPSAVFILTKE